MSEEARIEELKAKERELVEDLEEFKKEKDRLRQLLGDVGGRKFSKRDNVINILFLALVLVFFIIESATHLLPPFFSLEIGILLVSVKMVFMIHNQHKVNHFQFWILNSIEYRVNESSRRMREIEKALSQQKPGRDSS